MQNKTHRACNEVHTARELLRNLADPSKEPKDANTEDLINHLALSVSMVAGTIAQHAYDADGAEIRDTMIDIITALKDKIAGVTEFTERLQAARFQIVPEKLH